MVVFPACQNEKGELPVLLSASPTKIISKMPEVTETPIITEVPRITESPIITESPVPSVTVVPPIPTIYITPETEVITSTPTPTEAQEVVTGEHTHIFEEDTCVLCGRVLSVLRTTAHENTYLSGFLGSTNENSNVVRTRILRVIFCDYEDSEGHYFSDLNCWDVSRKQDGSIMAWYVDHSPNQYYDVYIAPAVENTIIQIHPDASYLFANLENQVSMRAGIYGLDKVEFSRTTNMSYLFAGTQLAADFVFNVDTSNVTDISYMYQADLNAPIEGNIQFGEKVDFSNVTRANGMFMNQSEIRELVLPDSLQLIGANMFYSCSKLRTVHIPEGVTAIGTDAFQFCTRLSAITLPETVTQIGSHAFGWCENLWTFQLPEKIEKIEENAFYNCKNLKGITWKGMEYTDAETLHTALREDGIIENAVWR